MTINAEITRGKVIAVLTLPYFQYKIYAVFFDTDETLMTEESIHV
jgi:hypothetical protein